MRLAILASLMISVLSVATGCGASGQSMRHSSTGANVADTSRDPAWTPPGEMDVSITETAHTAPAKPSCESMTMQPNKREVLRHQLRAATY